MFSLKKFVNIFIDRLNFTAYQLSFILCAVSTLYTVQSKYLINRVYNSENGFLMIYRFLEKKKEKNL